MARETIELRRQALIGIAGRYSLAAILSVGAWKATSLLWPWVAPNIAPLYFAAVMISTWFAGLGPGLLAALLCSAISSLLWPTAEPGRIDGGDVLRTITLFTTVCLINWLNAERRRAVEALARAKLLQTHLEEQGHRLQAINEHLQLEVTERKLAEERARADQQRLRKLTSELLVFEEKERRQIASQLHDSVGQMLAFSQMRLELLSQPSAIPSPTQINEVLDLLKSAIDDTRSLTRELSPPLLYESKFEVAMEWLAEKMQKEHNLPVFINCHGTDGEIPEEIRIFLFQALREMLVNVVKHASAREVHVTLYRQPKSVRIVVEDDGIGFGNMPPLDNDPSPDGFGLLNIRERASYMGGQFEIESVPKEGSRLTIVIPLSEGGARAG